MKRHQRAVLPLVLLLGWGASSEATSAQSVEGGWTFASSPFTDLWFHGMAVVDPFGPGPQPLYDMAYPSVIRRAKETRGLGSTRLDEEAGRLRDAFRRDPTFEVLHFLPLYFAGAGRTEIFLALETLAAEPEGIPRAPSVRTALGMAAVGGVLSTAPQRRVLGEFVSVLQAEWDAFFGPWWQEQRRGTGEVEAALREVWTERFLPALGPLLAGMEMDGGSALLSPAIGEEGRVFAGLPHDQTDNVMVIGRPADPAAAREAVYAMLRELSFPMARRALESVGSGSTTRDEGERLASLAAVRSGALILEKYLPEETDGYREFYLSRLGEAVPPGGAVAEVFQRAFPLDADLATALRDELANTATTGGVG